MKKNKSPISFFMLMAIFIFIAMGTVAEAAPTLVSGGLGSLGEIERITLNNPADVYSGGVMVVGGGEMIIPRNMLIDLPANRLTLQQIFDQAPAACKAQNPPESGLAKADKCNGSGSGGIATMHAVRTNAGNVIIGDLFIQKAAELVVGVVTYINYDQGYYRVNGITNDPNTGAMVRLNDPTSRHTIQSGPGCAGGPNCSPDPRLTLDPDNYTNTFATGYPVCIPSTVPRSFTNPLGGPTSSQASANGTGDYLCPDTNRTAALTEPPVADSRRFAPVKVGDSVTAEGNYETINGVRFLSAHTSTVQKALATSNALGQPDYLFLEEVDIEAPAFQNERQIAMFIGFTTFAPTDVDIWSLHRDPVNNATHEFPLASVQGCDVVQGGPGNCSAQGVANGAANTNIFKIIYRDDYLKPYDPKNSPCAHLLASPRFRNTGVCFGGGNFKNDFAVLSPIPHEIIARTGRKIDSATNPAIGELITIDINGNLATNGEYLFPLGLNLGGVGVAEMSEIDLNLTNSPTVFDGIPWALDRRLSPSGCLNGGCESLTTSPLGTFALDPFPFSGLDPRTQAVNLPTGSYTNPTFSPGTLTSVRDRIFSYVTDAGIFNGNATLLPCATGVFPANCPADPPLTPINPTPALNIFPPFADEDEAVVISAPGASVNINVLLNDIPILGTINPASLQIATNPGSGTVQINGNNTITYFPSNPFTVGSVTFTYTVANDFGSVSLPGIVTVTILRAPVAVNDSISIPALATLPIDLVSNDTVGSNGFNLASLSIVGPATCGTAVNQLNGTVNFTAPATTGSCTFSYTVSDTTVPAIVSNTASVTVTITPAIIAVANDDTAATTTGSTVSINVIANDTSATSTINPATLEVAAPTGGTAAANLDGTVTYKAPGTPGTYTFTYKVKDNSPSPTTSNVATVTITVTPAPPIPPASAATLTTTLTSPQNPGVNVMFVGQGQGGAGNYQYQFWFNNGSEWNLVQDYSSSEIWSWNTTGLALGTYAVQVNVRSAGSTVLPYEASNTLNYILTAPNPPAASAILVPSLTSPQLTGTTVTFVGSGQGGSGSYEYQYWLNNGATWNMVRDYSITNTWDWNTTGLAAGAYAVQINVRNAGSSALPYEAAKNVAFVLGTPVLAATAVDLTALPASPMPGGTTSVTFTGTGFGGSGSYEYQFWFNNGTSWILLQDYSTANATAWDPATVPAGTYQIQVNVRSAGSNIQPYEAAQVITYVK